MLLVVTDRAVPAGDLEWIVQALVRGVESESGGVTVITSLTDPQLHETSDAGIVAVLGSGAAHDIRSTCEAAAAAQVLVCSVAPSTLLSSECSTSTPLTMVLLEAGTNPPGNPVVAAVSNPVAVVANNPAVAAVNNPAATPARIVRVRADRPRRSVWALRRLGRTLASSACEPQRLDHSDHAIRRRSAATAAVDALEELLEADDVEEFQIRGGRSMMVQHSGGQRVRHDSPFGSDEELIEAVRFLAAYSGDRPQRFDELDPRLDIRVGTSWRLHAEAFVTSPPNVVLRSNMAGRMRLGDLGVACPQLERVLLEAITGKVRVNVVVAAAMGGGKTTLCQALLAAVPDHERIDTIEDTPELRLCDYGIHPNAYERLTRDPNQDGYGRHSMADHIRDAKRSNADKLVVGEIRGDGCAALLDAMSSGIDGCLVTLHSQPGKGVLEKLVAYACSEGSEPDYARRQIAAAVDLCVWIGRNDAAQRVIADVTQLTGIDPQTGVIATKCLWRLEPGQRWATPVGEPEGRVSAIYGSAAVGEAVDEAPVLAGNAPGGKR